MLNRLTQPWLVYLLLPLSVFIILAGFGIRAWGNEPGSAKVGLLSVWIGVGFLVLSLVLWSVMVWRRRTVRGSAA